MVTVVLVDTHTTLPIFISQHENNRSVVSPVHLGKLTFNLQASFSFGIRCVSHKMEHFISKHNVQFFTGLHTIDNRNTQHVQNNNIHAFYFYFCVHYYPMKHLKHNIPPYLCIYISILMISSSHLHVNGGNWTTMSPLSSIHSSITAFCPNYFKSSIK